MRRSSTISEASGNRGSVVSVEAASRAVSTSVEITSFQIPEGPPGPSKEKRNSRKQLLEPRGVKLEHGARLCFGKCYFFLVLPGMIAPEFMITSGQVSWDIAIKEMKQNKMRNLGHRVSGTLRQGSLGFGAGASVVDIC